MVEAQNLTATHPVRLGLALNFSVFQHEVLRDTQAAVATASDAFQAGNAGLYSTPEESRNDSILTLQLLRDNLSLWGDQAGGLGEREGRKNGQGQKKKKK